jgi:hypothetical protein
MEVVSPPVWNYRLPMIIKWKFARFLPAWAMIVSTLFLFSAFVFAEEFEAKKRPKLEDFLGKWTGKWDDKWRCEFTITKPKQKIIINYDWEENVGKKMQHLRRIGKITGDALQFGEMKIVISAKDSSRGKAFGDFAKPRTAELTQQPSPKKDEKEKKD